MTQIVRAGEADVFHTRQQHTIKVAQIGRRLAQRICRDQPHEAAAEGVDPEVVEAACLAHDLGHPPFGHIGEDVLDELVRGKAEKDGFDGNAQSFRILTKLAVRFDTCDGMDLTRATLAASLKYPWFREKSGKKSKKWSVYRTEKDDFAFARAFHAGEDKTAEAEIMDWADDVAYSVHDLEDFHRCNVIPWRRIFDDPKLLIDRAIESWRGAPPKAKGRLEAAHRRVTKYLTGAFSFLLLEPYEGTRDQREQLRRMTSQMINMYIKSIQLAPSGSTQRIRIEPNDEDEMRVLKQITRDYVIESPILAAQQHGQKKVIRDLFKEIYDGSIDDDYPPFLPVRLRYLRSISGTNAARFAADCIASLSENEAVKLHARIMGTSAGSVLDPIVR